MKKPAEYVSLFRSMSKEWRWILRYVSRYRLQIIVYVVIGILSTAMGIGSTVASKYLIDSVVSRDTKTVAISAVLAVSLALAQIVVNAVTSRVATVVGTKVSNEIRSNVYEHMVCSDWEDISKYHSGDLLNRIEGDVSALASSVISFVPNVFMRVTQFAGCLAVVLYYDPIMALFALLSAPFLAVTSNISAKMMRKYNVESRNMNGKILSFYSESIQNIQTIKAFGITGRYVGQLKDYMAVYRKMRLDHNKFSVVMTAGLSVIGLLVAYLCYGWGVWRLWQGFITFGTMTLFLQISGQLTSSFSAIVSLLPTSISIATAAGRIMEITDIPPEKNDDDSAAEDMAAAAEESGISLKCDNLTYAYKGTDIPVVKDISFYVNPGETVALVGPSGEGKTTILRLILGLVKPQDGCMTMSVADGRVLDVSASTRRFCSYVPQENAVFAGSIADNLRIVKPDAADKELVEALKNADAWGFIEKLPDGMYTQMNEKGVNFSEGPVQRISIARALL
ncbi:MAG: ABC transporter ATP-binding protein, partial [Clostridia bacterium]|nr:ABC transporter ATP-binding protein [Clostridia bacterium]